MHRPPASPPRRVVAGVAAALLLGGVGSSASVATATEPSDDDAAAVVEHYAAGVHAAYTTSLESATALDESIDAFVADPTDETMAAAKDAWLAARDDYGLTEAFRFYGGPIDDEDGPEGLINAWPLDEAYIDYVDGDATAGVVNDPDTYPTIDAELLTSLNEQGGEANISTGWHAIEFLLWGQDLSADGPGERPVSDYTTADHADRRATYLTVTSDLLLEHLGDLVDAWAPDADNYRADFVALDTDEALTMIVTGAGELTRGELAGERMYVAYEQRSQEDEHSCFSDNTNADLLANALGIQMVLSGSYPGLDGPGLLSLVGSADPDAAASLTEAVDAGIVALQAIPAPFDQHLADGVSDDDPGRASVLTAIDTLEDQADALVAAAAAIGVTVEV